MRATYLFITLFVFSGLVVLFGNIPSNSFPPIINTILGQNPENNTWYENLRLWQFDSPNTGEEQNETPDSRWQGILNTVGQYLVVGASAVAGIVTKSEYLIFGSLAVTMGIWFQSLWYAILISNPALQGLIPLNYFIYGILTFVYWFTVVEWLRGKA